MRKACADVGIFLDPASPNYALLKDRVVSYEGGNINIEKLESNLKKMQIYESRKRVILKLLQQYKETKW